MDDSPRSSKRRKLDTPTRKASSSFSKRALSKSAGRSVSRTASLLNGDTTSIDDENGTPSRASSRKSSTPKGTINGTLRKRGKTQQEEDIYDDIEGALNGDSPVPSPAPSLGRGASRKSFQTLVNGYRHGTDLEAEIQDELAAELSTPTRRAKNTYSIRKPQESPARRTNISPSKSGRGASRGIVERTDDADLLDQLQINGINDTPSSKRASDKKPRQSAKAQGQARKHAQEESHRATPSRSSRRRAPVSDSEDELGGRGSPSGTSAVKGRRRAHRVDHVRNRDSADDRVGDAVVEVGGEDGGAVDFDANSVVGSVLDPTEPSPFNKPSSAQKKKNVAISLHASLSSGRELDLLKSVVIERITAKRLVPLIGLDDEYKSVYQLVEHTVTAGEGNSMLLIGARGSGKSALVNKVLTEVSKDNSEDYHVVRLNGFIHTDDKIALREIWRQLGKEMDIEEDGGLGKNYADTLTTLLALLSHPSEQTGELTDQVAKAVIFIMDEFDLFASHPRQTLLYNLFDIAQSRKAPIAVLGLTTRIDVANSLEKRVKSRFSHRYVHLSLAKSFTTFQEICKASLLVQPDQLSVEERVILCPSVTTTSAKSKKTKEATTQNILSEWNANITSLFASKVFLTEYLAPHFYLTKSPPAVLTSFLYPTATLSVQTPTINPSTLLSPPDSKLSLIPQLPTLALSLLIAAARLDIIHDSDTCNFNMAYDEYVTLASKARIQSAAGGASASGSVSKVWGKEVAKREWEGLVELGLVVPVVSGQTGGFGMVKCDVALEEIGAVVTREKGIERALERWCRQI